MDDTQKALQKQLLEFCALLPENGLAFAPIGTKVAKKPMHGTSPAPSREGADKHQLGIWIEDSHSDPISAIGLWTGPITRVLILDVDMDLAGLKEKYNELNSADQCVVTSPRENAAKFIYRLPEGFDTTGLRSVSLSDTKKGYEILFNNNTQGIIFGKYNNGKGLTGDYTFHGDLADLKEPPPWIIAEMKLQAEQRKRGGMLKKRKNRYDGRSEDEYAEMIQACLNVMPIEDFGGYEDWWPIGAAICTHLPNERGWDLFWGWSKGDEAFSDTQHEFRARRNWDAWLRNEQAEEGMKRSGYSFGTISHAADQYDQHRTRFTDAQLDILNEAESPVQKTQEKYTEGDELLRAAMELEETIEDPALLDQAKHILALSAGRKCSGDIDRLLDAHDAYGLTKGNTPEMPEDIGRNKRQFMIPGVLSAPYTVLLHADGGAGKTTMAMTLARHLLKGVPIDVRGMKCPINTRKVLWLNGDQNIEVLIEQFEDHGIEKLIRVQRVWDINWYRPFCRMQQEGQYDLIVIDSLDGCNDANPHEENKREYALPLKKLVRGNGTAFPACCIIVLHHNTKQGVFRGTSALKACVDETWNMRIATADEIAQRNLRQQARIVTVEKSRMGREGDQSVFFLRDTDWTYAIYDLTEFTRGPRGREQDVLRLVMERQHLGLQTTLKDLNDHELTRKTSAHDERNRRAVQRLIEKDLLQAEEVQTGGRGRPSKTYTTNLQKHPFQFGRRPFEEDGRSS